MDTLPFKITPARTDADYEDISSLFCVYANGLGVDLCFQDFAKELATLPGKYTPPKGELLIARDRVENAVGCVALRPLSGEACEMKRLYVAPEARGTGLGKALTQTIIAEALRIGYRQMWLDSLPTMREAIILYRRLGFTDIAPYYETPVEGTVFLGKLLAT